MCVYPTKLYQVDLYMAGHVHSYSASWPILAGKFTKNFTDPQGTVHITEVRVI